MLRRVSFVIGFCRSRSTSNFFGVVTDSDSDPSSFERPTNRALDVLLAQEAAVPAFNDSPTPAYGVEEEEEEEEGKAIAESGSSSPSTSSSPSRTKEAFKGERGSPAAAEAEAEADGIDDGGHDDGGMVTVSAASKADVARYMAKAAGAGRPASPAPSSPQRPPEGVEGEVDGGGGGGDADGMGSLCLWELLKTMFIDMLPEGALGATYAHHHRGGGAGGGEGDLVAMVEVRGWGLCAWR